MDPSSITDEIIHQLLNCPKVIQSKRPRSVPKAKHLEQNLDVLSADGQHLFTLIVRQSTMVSDSYSCGLLWHPSTSQKLMLTRYNGSDHEHYNPTEESSFEDACHIHRATERYISAGRKAEHYAEQTTRYNNVNEAMACLMADCNIRWQSPPSSSTDTQFVLTF